jgi:hypothetical protein
VVGVAEQLRCFGGWAEGGVRAVVISIHLGSTAESTQCFRYGEGNAALGAGGLEATETVTLLPKVGSASAMGGKSGLRAAGSRS